VDLTALATAQSTCQQTQEWRDREDVQVVRVSDQELLCDNSTGSLRPIVPATCCRAVFNSVHGLAHAGIRATRRMLTSRYMLAWVRD